MIPDSKLHRDVIEELEWEPSLDASKIGVTATAGIITLTGTVSRYVDKLEAERVVKSVAGVQAVANDIEVRLPGSFERNDTDIAQAAMASLKWHSTVPDGQVKV